MDTLPCGYIECDISFEPTAARQQGKCPRLHKGRLVSVTRRMMKASSKLKEDQEEEQEEAIKKGNFPSAHVRTQNSTKPISIALENSYGTLFR